MSDKTNVKAYEFEVDETEVEETEGLRSQALAQFREWIKKHPNIIKCRTDDAFLLRFLRTKKYRITDAFQLLENYLMVRKLSPHLFEVLSKDDPDFAAYTAMQSSYVLPQLDKKGRIVVFFALARIDMNIYTTRMGLKLFVSLFEYLCHKEVSQLNGIVYVSDWTGTSMAHTALMTPTSIKEYAESCINNFPLREKLFYFVNLPPFMNALMQIVKSFMSVKMRNRIRIVSGYSEISDEIGINIFPKEYGGEMPKDDIFKLSVEETEKCREEIQSVSCLDIKLSKSSNNFGNSTDAHLDSSIVGSFRKIEVD